MTRARGPAVQEGEGQDPRAHAGSDDTRRSCRPPSLHGVAFRHGPSCCPGGEPACPPGDGPKSWERQPSSRVAWDSAPWDGRQPGSPGHSGCAVRAGARTMREEEEARTSCRCHPQRPHPPWPPSAVPPGGGQREPGHPGVAAAGPQPHALPSAHVPTPSRHSPPPGGRAVVS